jgi:hypothetical protein
MKRQLLKDNIIYCICCKKIYDIIDTYSNGRICKDCNKHISYDSYGMSLAHTNE